MGNHSFIFGLQGDTYFTKLTGTRDLKDVFCTLRTAIFYLGPLVCVASPFGAICAKSSRRVPRYDVAPRAGMVAWPWQCRNVSWAASMHGREGGGAESMGKCGMKNGEVLWSFWLYSYFGTAQFWPIPTWDTMMSVLKWGGLGITGWPKCLLLGCSGPTMSHPNIANCVAAKKSVYRGSHS